MIGPGAAWGNRYAAKPKAERRECCIYVWLTAREKARVVKSANGRALAEWARSRLLTRSTSPQAPHK